MGIFEKFRTQPRWKHADPGVRMAAIYELGTDEQQVLSGIVRDDADARVRRAAVSRVDDAPLLGDVLRTDPDSDVRAEALRRLVGLAAETSDTETARAVVAQLVDAGHSRELVVVARDSAHADVKAVVVEAVTDSRALGAISRQATDGPTRLLALSRLSDADELCQVALRSEYTDSAVAAFGHLIDPGSIAAVAQRARNKVAMRKARARERLLEDALRAVRPAPAQAPTMSGAAIRPHQKPTVRVSVKPT